MMEKPCKSVRDILGGLIMAMLLLGLCSCGKKGPPVPPDRTPPPQVEDLSAELEDQTVTLHWAQSPGSGRVEGYWIYRAATALGGADCSDCPLLFQKQGEVSAAIGQKDFRFSEAVRPGFRYTYKIRPYNPSGIAGPYSNLATVQLLP